MSLWRCTHCSVLAQPAREIAVQSPVLGKGASRFNRVVMMLHLIKGSVYKFVEQISDHGSCTAPALLAARYWRRRVENYLQIVVVACEACQHRLNSPGHAWPLAKDVFTRRLERQALGERADALKSLHV